MNLSEQPDLSTQTKVQAEIEEQLKEFLSSHSDSDIFVIADIVSLEWDHVFVFGENTSYIKVNKALGFKWLPEKEYYIDELSDLLVFVKDQHVVEYVMVSGDLFVAFSKNEFSRDNAVFKIMAVDDPVRPKVIMPIP